MLKKIVIIGPESTGKSTLCDQLASHYHTIWCPEYAREYLLKYGMNYTYDDLLRIARGQVELEQAFVKSLVNPKSKTQKQKWLFLDTDMYVMKVWCEFVFGKCHRYILDKIVDNKYDLYLLCDTDLPWTKDELREYPELESRRILFNMYKDCMINQSTPWALISGTYEERLQKAISEVDRVV